MLSRKNKRFILKLVSLFSVVRGYNILIIVLAQYLTSIFILAPDKRLSEILFDPNLFFLVLAGVFTIASGYIINSFYDSEKDLINRPKKTMLDRLVSQNTKLSIYFTLNFLAVIAASYVSFKAVVFYALYIFGIWIYSHKLKKIPFLGNLVAATLAITPFFAVFIYYGNLAPVIFVHGSFLFLVIAMREMVKDLENLKGDFAQRYRTIPVMYGATTSKWLLSLLAGLTVIPVFFLINHFKLGYMTYYFYGSALLLFVFLVILWQSKARPHYVLLHNILKFIIVAGVFCIILLDASVVLHRIF
ncbi:geranylgeranylglycerol-phosphate geranylgeranyltransferase [Dokdonia donghaensis]|uniref:Ubiquinone biosynthesis protein UbiA n=1 Tax=Dokdonia donghaensis DSW-1 TaxID=1300343 RepID=A0A0A2GVC1_9FLAO|nr:geranylgeranylglycerol-phosphate geranylgeranyltransferase [Dokdonia donghaensis]ANH59865.1 prenyltransferase [Dokdonia donghaensis DSW-1]KGO07192.1 ubiquinone biosynthesis protein UbiA [Dokdonia donghaensis DSW-1]